LCLRVKRMRWNAKCWTPYLVYGSVRHRGDTEPHHRACSCTGEQIVMGPARPLQPLSARAQSEQSQSSAGHMAFLQLSIGFKHDSQVGVTHTNTWGVKIR
jgi:hypothetical protein